MHLLRLLAALAALLVAAHAHAFEAGWMQIQVAGTATDAPMMTVCLYCPTKVAPRTVAKGPLTIPADTVSPLASPTLWSSTMHPAHETTSTLDAKVEELLPMLGLAYVVDQKAQAWGVSRSTPGSKFDALAPGRRVRLLIQSNQHYSVVRECRLID